MKIFVFQFWVFLDVPSVWRKMVRILFKKGKKVESDREHKRKIDFSFSAYRGFQKPFQRLFLWGSENAVEEDLLTLTTLSQMKALPRNPLAWPTRPPGLLEGFHCQRSWTKSIKAIQFGGWRGGKYEGWIGGVMFTPGLIYLSQLSLQLHRGSLARRHRTVIEAIH